MTATVPHLGDHDPAEATPAEQPGWTLLEQGWTLAAVTFPPGLPDTVRHAVVNAQVPGFVHTDLLAADLIPDPYLERNEEQLQWIGRTAWRYTYRFPRPADTAERHDLVLDGLDTLATITVNGREVGRTRNMHRGYRFDVTGLLGEYNEIVIEFAAILDHIEQRAAALGILPHGEHVPYNEVRKMACNFGWDWGPAVAGAGIWKRAGLHSWITARLTSVRPHVTVVGGESAILSGDPMTGHVTIDIGVERTGFGDQPLTVTVALGENTTYATVSAGQDRVRVDLDVPDVRLWWPIGRGDQARYDLHVTLTSPDSPDPLDTWRRAVGFRTVRIDTSPDDGGTAFRLVVNGEQVQVRGANWIPDDAFPTRVTPQRYRRRLAQAIGANVNLLRVWGGGMFESDTFYDICDELGLLTWQDFLFACAAYRQDEDTAAEIEAEARQNITRLMHHPSLILWCGCNENLWAREEWLNWQTLNGRAWGAHYYHQLLPDLVTELDPTRPYVPGSPYSGQPGVPANDQRHGLTHIWDVWNELDYTAFRDKHPRFASEFGYCGPPTWSTLTRAISPEQRTPESATMHAHNKAADGPAKLRHGLARHFPIPTHPDDWHYLTQVNQARAVQLGIEHFRSLSEKYGGSVMWQLNDCWPVISWAAIDGDGRLKPLYYALRAAYAPQLVTVQPDGAALAVVIDNDTATTWNAQLSARRMTMHGESLATREITATVPARSTTTLTLPNGLTSPGDPDSELLIVDGGPRRATWFYSRDLTLRYPPADYSATVTDNDGTTEVTVTAHTLLRDLCLFPDRIQPDAVTDDLMLTLLPGETHTFHVTGAALTTADRHALTTTPALRCINDGRLCPNGYPNNEDPSS